MKSSRSAAASERSITTPARRGPAAGPRSTISTSTLAPVDSRSTRTRVPNGSVGCAATIAWRSNGIPLAVVRPWKAAPYQLASHSSWKRADGS